MRNTRKDEITARSHHADTTATRTHNDDSDTGNTARNNKNDKAMTPVLTHNLCDERYLGKRFRIVCDKNSTRRRQRKCALDTPRCDHRAPRSAPSLAHSHQHSA